MGIRIKAALVPHFADVSILNSSLSAVDTSGSRGLLYNQLDLSSARVIPTAYIVCVVHLPGAPTLIVNDHLVNTELPPVSAPLTLLVPFLVYNNRVRLQIRESNMTGPFSRRRFCHRQFHSVDAAPLVHWPMQ